VIAALQWWWNICRPLALKQISWRRKKTITGRNEGSWRFYFWVVRKRWQERHDEEAWNGGLMTIIPIFAIPRYENWAQWYHDRRSRFVYLLIKPIKRDHLEQCPPTHHPPLRCICNAAIVYSHSPSNPRGLVILNVRLSAVRQWRILSATEIAGRFYFRFKHYPQLFAISDFRFPNWEFTNYELRIDKTGIYESRWEFTNYEYSQLPNAHSH